LATGDADAVIEPFVTVGATPTVAVWVRADAPLVSAGGASGACILAILASEEDLYWLIGGGSDDDSWASLAIVLVNPSVAMSPEFEAV
jgi:hypothetical protein